MSVDCIIESAEAFSLSNKEIRGTVGGRAAAFSCILRSFSKAGA